MNTRTQMLLGEDKLNLLSSKKVAVFGIGGVGSFVAESLARTGVGSLVLIDDDFVTQSNLNRQLIALSSTTGMSKTDVMERRIHDINSSCDVMALHLNINKNTISDDLFDGVDYIVDAIDTVTSKLLLVEYANRLKIPIISSMGTGNKLNPSLLKVADINYTKICPLARVIRREVKKRNISTLKVVYSEEEPVAPIYEINSGRGNKKAPASYIFVPATCGLLIGYEVIKDLLERD